MSGLWQCKAQLVWREVFKGCSALLMALCCRRRTGGGNRTHRDKKKRGKTGRRVGGLKPQPAFNLSQTTGSWCPMPYILRGMYTSCFQPVTQMETEIYKRWATSSSDVAFHAVRCADRLTYPSTLRAGDGQVHLC